MEKLQRALDNWPALSRLLDEALELTSRQRSAWIAALPAEHEALKPELERMLGRSSGVSSCSFVGDLPPVVGRSTEDRFRAGDSVGPWRLLRKIGEGGMASVWEAERRDGLFTRQVAIKLPHHGWPREALAERIAREREILARLNHPNIARLLDAGTTVEGQPWLALEYVEGQAIDDYCREHNLPLAKRLELFLQVAAAIAYAHTALVVHRDLKPSNILVTSAGEVRVLDFGIAKILDPSETRETELTRISGRALTLDYASPEQITGEPLTVASDVYSLGVLLFELLTGDRPYRLRRQSRAALEEAILEAEPRPPSDAAVERTMQRALRGDLDTIVLRALKKQPAERYHTVEKLADDIERYLHDRPVLARPDSVSYRVAKFVRRNRFKLGIAVAAATLLLAAIVTILLQARVSLAQKQQIAAARAFVVPLLLEAHAYNGGMAPASALQLLRQVEQHMERIENADSETRVEVLNIATASLFVLHDTLPSEALAQKALRAAAALDAGHAQSLRARLLMNWVRLSRGQTDQIRRDIGPLLHDMRSSRHTLAEDLAGALRIRSAVAVEEGNSEEAESSAVEALGIAESRLGLHHNQSVLSLIDLCYAYAAAGEGARAVEAGERARERALAVYAHRVTHPNVLKAREAHAVALAAAGDSERGLREMDDAIRATTSTFGPSSRAVGFALRRLARMQLNAGRAAEARQSVEGAIAILGEHLTRESPGFARTLALREAVAAAASVAPAGIQRGR